MEIDIDMSQFHDIFFEEASEGIVVIPKKMEQKVLEKAFAIIRKEEKILFDISSGLDPAEILQKRGEF